MHVCALYSHSSQENQKMLSDPQGLELQTQYDLSWGDLSKCLQESGELRLPSGTRVSQRSGITKKHTLTQKTTCESAS